MSHTLPQLDSTYFVSQFFWLAIAFSIIYIFMRFWFIPKVQNLFLLRKKYIDDLQKELEVLQSKLTILEKKYHSSITAISQQVAELKQNAIKQFDITAKEQITKTEQQIEQMRKQTKNDILDWQKKMKKDIQQVGFEHIKYLINKVAGINIHK